MTDETNTASATDVAPVETPLEKKRREDRERKRIERAEKKARESENQSFESKKEVFEAQWGRNFKKLSATAKEELNTRISYFNYIFGDILNGGSHRMAADEEYGHANDKFIDMRPERWLNELECFVKSHPVEEEKEFDFQSLADRSPSFQQFGVDIDTTPAPAYYGFLYYFKIWFAKNRLALVLEQDPEDMWSCDWQKVEEICAANPRLGRSPTRTEI